MIVQVTTATVYVTPGGRRCLTKATAYRRAAWERIAAKYPCGCESDHDTGYSYTCGAHTPEGEERIRRLHARLVRFMKRADRRST